MIFIWLTTDREFQRKLESSTSRNKRLLAGTGFTISGPPKGDWKRIIQETFSFHNSDKSLADFGVVDSDLATIIANSSSIGDALGAVGIKLAATTPKLQNLSEYRVIMVWPVVDGTRMQRILQFTRPRDGYQLNWDAWLREINETDRNTLPLHDYNLRTESVFLREHYAVLN